MKRLHRALFALGLASLALGFCGGIYYAITREGALPGLAITYGPHVQRLLAAGDVDTALEQLELGAVIGIDVPSALDELAAVAAVEGDTRRAAFALDRRTHLGASDALARTRAAEALLREVLPHQTALRPGDAATLARALEHAAAAIRLAPSSPEAHNVAGLAHLIRAQRLGREAEWPLAVRHLERALELDPSLSSAASALELARAGAAG